MAEHHAGSRKWPPFFKKVGSMSLVKERPEKGGYKQSFSSRLAGLAEARRNEMEKCIATIGSTAATAAIAVIVATLLLL